MDYAVTSQRTADKRQKSEDRSQKTEDRRQKTEDRRQKTEDSNDPGREGWGLNYFGLVYSANES